MRLQLVRVTETNAELAAALDDESRFAELLVKRQGTFRQRASLRAAVCRWRQHAVSPEKAAVGPAPEEKENTSAGWATRPPYMTPEMQLARNATPLSTGSAADTHYAGGNNIQGWNAGGNLLATPTLGLMG